jgi:predicted HTH transcriptional regulator
VRANFQDLSKGIHQTDQYLIRFLSNLLLGKKHSLKNREMHVQYNDTVKLENDTVNDTVFDLIKENNKITAIEISKQLKISLSTAKRKIKDLKECGEIERKGSDKVGYWKIIEH